MHLSQIVTASGVQVVARDGAVAHVVPRAASVYDLAMAAIAAGRSLVDEVASRGAGASVDLATATMTLPV